MKVFVPSPLHSYTGGQSMVDASGASLREIMGDLDARYPGLRFRIIDEQDRIREHIKFFVNGERALGLDQSVRSEDEIHIIAALSGG